jgi:23S rRNA pseudouridine2605 synthase
MENRLSKILASCGIASRRAAEKLIFDGRVKVNGRVVLIPQTRVHLEKDEIEVNGTPLQKSEKKVYFLLNKPAGFHCTNARFAPNCKLVVDLFQHTGLRLFTVGRLDKETTGALIVTNDGNFGHQLIHPSFGHEKEYLVKTQQEILPEHLEALSRGTKIQGTLVRPKAVKKVRRGTLKIIVTEGKKHEVRELVKAANLTLLSLTRLRIGPFVLGTLPIGEWRPLSEAEIFDLSA